MKDLEKINLTPKTLEEATESISHLAKIIIELKKENDSLREQINRNSKNSSTPPSQDRNKKKVKKTKSGRKRGGQPGHKASQRIMIPSEQVSAIIDCKPEGLCDCGGAVTLDKVQIHQVFEIPLPKYDVTEYRIHKGCCRNCRRKYEGKLPNGISWKGFGIRTQAMISLLTSKYRLSKRLVQAWFNDVYKMPICLGSVSNIEHTVSQALKPIHEETFTIVQNEKIKHVDETGHKECNKNGWAWIASTVKHTCFTLHRSRGKKIAKEVIGNPQGKIIITDRYPSYDYLPAENHQICWAHLKRDFQKISEREGMAGKIGRKLLKTYKQLFCFWKIEYQNEKIPKKQRRRLKYFKRKMLKWLEAGTYCKHDKTARTCENILSFEKSLWRFFEVKDVSPTNNHAERQLRPLVISKKLTFGTQSERGSRFVERIFTVVMTCRQQGRDTLAFIVDGIQKYFLGDAAPSLALTSAI